MIDEINRPISKILGQIRCRYLETRFCFMAHPPTSGGRAIRSSVLTALHSYAPCSRFGTAYAAATIPCAWLHEIFMFSTDSPGLP